MSLEFPMFKVTFIDEDRFDDMEIHKKLAHMANTGNANIGGNIFSFGIARCDFPDLFEKILNKESYNGLSLKNVVVHRRLISFTLVHEGDNETTNLDISLEGTCGKCQVNEGENRLAVMEWANGELRDFNMMICGRMTHMLIQD